MINFIHFAVSCLCFAVFPPMNSAEETINASLFDKFAGYRVRNPVTSFILSSGHFSECCLRCLKYQNCYSINIHRDDQICEINTLGPSEYGDLVDTNGTWTLYVRTNGNYLYRL